MARILKNSKIQIKAKFYHKMSNFGSKVVKTRLGTLDTLQLTRNVVFITMDNKSSGLLPKD